MAMFILSVTLNLKLSKEYIHVLSNNSIVFFTKSRKPQIARGEQKTNWKLYSLEAETNVYIWNKLQHPCEELCPSWPAAV